MKNEKIEYLKNEIEKIEKGLIKFKDGKEDFTLIKINENDINNIIKKYNLKIEDYMIFDIKYIYENKKNDKIYNNFIIDLTYMDTLFNNIDILYQYGKNNRFDMEYNPCIDFRRLKKNEKILENFKNDYLSLNFFFDLDIKINDKFILNLKYIDYLKSLYFDLEKEHNRKNNKKNSNLIDLSFLYNEEDIKNITLLKEDIKKLENEIIEKNNTLKSINNKYENQLKSIINFKILDFNDIKNMNEEEYNTYNEKLKFYQKIIGKINLSEI